LSSDLAVILAGLVQQVNRPRGLCRGVREFLHACLVVLQSLLESKSLVRRLLGCRLDRIGAGKGETSPPSELVDNPVSYNPAHDRIVRARLVIGPAPPNVPPRFLKGILRHAEIPTGLAAGKGEKAGPVGTPPPLELCLRVRWLHPLALLRPVRPSPEKRNEQPEFEGAPRGIFLPGALLPFSSVSRHELAHRWLMSQP
jgi:hypothetical protein